MYTYVYYACMLYIHISILYYMKIICGWHCVAYITYNYIYKYIYIHHLIMMNRIYIYIHIWSDDWYFISFLCLDLFGSVVPDVFLVSPIPEIWFTWEAIRLRRKQWCSATLIILLWCCCGQKVATPPMLPSRTAAASYRLYRLDRLKQCEAWECLRSAWSSNIFLGFSYLHLWYLWYIFDIFMIYLWLYDHIYAHLWCSKSDPLYSAETGPYGIQDLTPRSERPGPEMGDVLRLRRGPEMGWGNSAPQRRMVKDGEPYG